MVTLILKTNVLHKPKLPNSNWNVGGAHLHPDMKISMNNLLIQNAVNPKCSIIT